MGKWSQYSEEWEQQRIEKFIEKADIARREFEKKPWLYKAIVRGLTTIKYYGALCGIHARMLFDRKYREEIKRETDHMDGIQAIVDLIKEKMKD